MVTLRVRLPERIQSAKLKAMYNNSSVSDIILKPSLDAASREILACKCVLAMWSPVFESMFFKPVDKPVTVDYSRGGRTVTLTTDYEVMEIALKFIHGHEVDIPFHALWRLHNFATSYQIIDLEATVADLLDRSVNCDTCCELVMEAFASGSHDHEALKKAMNVALSDFPSVCQTPGFMSIDFSVLEVILSSDNLAAPEEVICDAGIAWLTHDSSRAIRLDAILHFIRFPLLPPQYAIALETNPVLSKSPLLNSLILSSLKYHMGGVEIQVKQRRGGLFWRISKKDTCMNVDGDGFKTFTLSTSTELLGQYWKIEYCLLSGAHADVVFGLSSLNEHATDYYVGRYAHGFGIALTNGNLYNGKCNCETSSKELCTPLCPTFLSFSSPAGVLEFWYDPVATDWTIKTDKGTSFSRRLYVDGSSKSKLYPCVSLINAKAKIVSNHDST
jgi:BTB And C-terminal Kelch/BTB/POZ domain